MSIGAPRVKSDGCMRRRILVARGAPIFGIDVGEDFLDLAMLSARSRGLSYHRVALVGISESGCDSIAQPHRRCGRAAISEAARAGRFASHAARCRLLRREDGRIGPTRLRRESSMPRCANCYKRHSIATMRPLSMFPTPLASYFAGCVAHHQCKPHLRAIAEELLASDRGCPATTRQNRGRNVHALHAGRIRGLSGARATRRPRVRGLSGFADAALVRRRRTSTEKNFAPRRIARPTPYLRELGDASSA